MFCHLHDFLHYFTEFHFSVSFDTLAPQRAFFVVLHNKKKNMRVMWYFSMKVVYVYIRVWIIRWCGSAGFLLGTFWDSSKTGRLYLKKKIHKITIKCLNTMWTEPRIFLWSVSKIMEKNINWKCKVCPRVWC